MGDHSESLEVRGEFEDMIRLEALKVFDGRYINQGDWDERRKVSVIGDRTRELLFDEGSGIGEYVRLGGVEFRVIGTFDP